MSNVSIPEWNSQGIIPPINTQRPTDIGRSPYIVPLTDFALRFGQSAERRVVLDGLLRYRAALHYAGLTQGFQWLDGSFLENIEALESRPPNDIDVVTFYDLPEGKSQMDLMHQVSDIFPATRAAKIHLKNTYHVDAYLEHLGKTPSHLIKRSTYWYSMWSHRRNQVWKGFVQIDLAPTEDAAAIAALAGLDPKGELA
jgi:hypothetical protein